MEIVKPNQLQAAQLKSSSRAKSTRSAPIASSAFEIVESNQLRAAEMESSNHSKSSQANPHQLQAAP